MQKLLLSAFLFAMTSSFLSCSKKNSNSIGISGFGTTTTATTPPLLTGIPVGKVPTVFTKKAIIEKFTVEW